MAGLATACRLAAQGFQVEIFEANSYPGGKLTTLEKDGFRFDAGPSLFTLPELVDDIFKACNRNPRLYFDYHKLEESCRYFFEDGLSVTAHADRDLLVEEFSKKFGVQKEKIERYLNNSEELYNSTARIFLENALNRFSTWLSKDVAKALLKLPKMGLLKSLHQFNATALQEPRLVQLFDRYATYNGSNPFRAPGILSTIPHLELNKGAYYPVGGMHSITQALVKLAFDLGVKIHFNSRVDSILTEGQNVIGIRSNGEHFNADVVVSNMDVYFTYKTLLQKKIPKRIEREERSSSALIFYWGIRHSFKQLGLHNIFFAKDYEHEFNTLFNENRVADDPTVYVNITSKHTPTDAPSGCENWFVMVNVPPNNGQPWDDLIKTTRASIITKLSRQLSMEIEPLIGNEEILDPRLIESRTSSYQGSLYGTSSNSRIAAFMRHPNASSSFKNLFFVGGSVHPGGGIPLCLHSAAIASDLIREQYGV